MVTYFFSLLKRPLRLLTVLQWLPEYNRQQFFSDGISGIILAAYAIPVSLAYATLAGLPPQYGIYGYLVGGFFYAMLGTGKQLAIGPTSAISMLIGTTLTSFAEGDVQRWVDIASLTALVFSVMSVLFYLLKLSSIINFISETVLLGFKAGAAIVIAMTQLPKIFGIPGGGESFYSRCIVILQQLPDTNVYVLIFGLIAIGIIIAGEKLLPHKPVSIFVVVLSILIASLFPLNKYGFTMTGYIPSGLPTLRVPDLNFSDLQHIIPLAFACFLLAYIESVSSARTLASKNGYTIDARQELLALGIANLTVSFSQGYPVSGGLSQSVVNEKAGAKTPMSLIVASAVIAICLLFLTRWIKNLPVVILAAIVLTAIKSLIDIKEFRRLYKVNRYDFFIAALAMFSVVIFGILEGVVIASVASLLMIIRIVSNPHVAFLGRIPGTNRFSDFDRHPDNEKIPHLLLFRVEAPLLYFNVSNVYQTIKDRISQSESDLKAVIFDLSTSAYIDSAGAMLIKKLYLELKMKGITFRVVEAHSKARDILRMEGIEPLIGYHISRKDSLYDFVISLLNNIENETLRG